MEPMDECALEDDVSDQGPVAPVLEDGSPVVVRHRQLGRLKKLGVSEDSNESPAVQKPMGRLKRLSQRAQSPSQDSGSQGNEESEEPAAHEVEHTSADKTAAEALEDEEAGEGNDAWDEEEDEEDALARQLADEEGAGEDGGLEVEAEHEDGDDDGDDGGNSDAEGGDDGDVSDSGRPTRRGPDRIGAAAAPGVDDEDELDEVLMRLKNKKKMMAAGAARLRGVAVDQRGADMLSHHQQEDHPQEQNQPDNRLPAGPINFASLLARLKAKQQPAPQQQLPRPPPQQTMAGAAGESVSMPMDETSPDQPERQHDGEAALGGAAQAMKSAQGKAIDLDNNEDEDEDDDLLEIVADQKTPGKTPCKEPGTTDDQVTAALDTPGVDAALLRASSQPVHEPLNDINAGDRKTRKAFLGAGSRMARMGSVTMINHGMAKSTHRQDSLPMVGSQSLPSSEQQPGDAGKDTTAPGKGKDDGSDVAEEEEEEEEEEDEASSASGSEVGSEDEEQEAVGSGDEEGEEGEEEEDEEDEEMHAKEDDEPEPEPLNFEELEPEVEGGEAEQKTDKAAAVAAANKKGLTHKPPIKRGPNKFIDTEAELSDEDEGGRAAMSDDEEEDDLDEGVLKDLIGDVREGARDELRRAQLYRELLEKQDAKDMRQLLDGVRNGFKKKRRAQLGDDDDEEGTDREARRRRAALFDPTPDDAEQGVAEWAMAGAAALVDEEEDEQEEDVAATRSDGAQERSRDARKRLRTTVAEEVPVTLHLSGSEEIRALMRAGRAASLPAAPKPAAPGLARSASSTKDAGLLPPKVGTAFKVFGREVSNQPNEPAPGSFVGKVPKGGHRSTSNLGGRSFVFGTSEQSNTADPDASHKDHGGSKPGALRPGEAQPARPTSFAGMKGLLSKGAEHPPLPGPAGAQRASKKESLFNLLESINQPKA